jgi:hypothetical protein
LLGEHCGQLESKDDTEREKPNYCEFRYTESVQLHEQADSCYIGHNRNMAATSYSKTSCQAKSLRPHSFHDYESNDDSDIHGHSLDNSPEYCIGHFPFAQTQRQRLCAILLPDFVEDLHMLQNPTLPHFLYDSVELQ